MTYRVIFNLWGDKAPKWRFSSADRESIKKSAVKALCASGITQIGPTERQRVKDFVIETELCVALDVAVRAEHPRAQPSKTDLAPLADIAGALDTIDEALKKLRRLPGLNGAADSAIGIDVGIRARCLYRKWGATQFEPEITQRMVDAVCGGAIDAYLPEGPGVYSLQWFLDALRSTVRHESSKSQTRANGRLPGSRNQNLAQALAGCFIENLNIPLLVRDSESMPFLDILRRIFDCLKLTGKQGELVTDKTLALYARHAARHWPFSAD